MRYLTLILFLYGIATTSFAQEVEKHQKNGITIDLFLPVFGTAQLQYERLITKNISLNLSVGYKFSSGVLKLKGIDRNAIKTDDFNFKGFKIIPEFRWYPQKNKVAGFGFYTGAY